MRPPCGPHGSPCGPHGESPWIPHGSPCDALESPSGFMRIPQGPHGDTMGVLEGPWGPQEDPMGIQGRPQENLGKLMVTHGAHETPWGPMALQDPIRTPYGNPLGHHGDPMETPWASMGLNGDAMGTPYAKRSHGDPVGTSWGPQWDPSYDVVRAFIKEAWLFRNVDVALPPTPK